MREILFRGKRIDNGEWVYGYLVPRSILNEAHYLDEFWIATGFEDEAYPVTTETVGQYTGLTDKNGTKIFEGDKLDYKGEVYTVRFDTSESRFDVLSEIYGDYNLNEMKADVFKVIGNIHEGVQDANS